jgi:hypothetical protein
MVTREVRHYPISACPSRYSLPNLSAHAYHSVFGEHAKDIRRAKLYHNVELVMCSKLCARVTCS